MSERDHAASRGSITLEATIALSAFLFFMMFLYSLIVMTTAQSAISIAALRSAESLSLDSYANNQFYEKSSMGNALAQLFGITGNPDTTFSAQRAWYNSSGDLEATVRTRFEGYLAGGEATAQARLSAMHVTDLSFQGSTIDGDGNLIVRLRYRIEPAYNLFGLVSIPVEKEVCSRLWADVGPPKDGG